MPSLWRLWKKALNSVEHAGVFTSMWEQGVDEDYIEIIQNIYENGTSIIRLHKDTDEIKIGKGVRQGDTISLKSFTASLEHIP